LPDFLDRSAHSSNLAAPIFFERKPFGGASLKGLLVRVQVLASRWRTVEINRSDRLDFFGTLLQSSN
jgi:hypothetical protein